MLKIKRLKNKIVAFILMAFFLITPFSFELDNVKIKKIKADEKVPIIFPKNPKRIIEINDQFHQWKKDDVIIIKGAVVIKSGASLMIEKGSTVKFEKEEGEIAPFIFVEKGGLLIAQGDEKEKIIFTSDQENSNFSLVFDGYNENSSYSGFLRYVEISKAGGLQKIGENQNPEQQSFLPFVFNKVLAADNEVDVFEEDRFPVNHLGGILQIENCRFFNNNNPDIYISNQQINLEELAMNDGVLVSITNSNFENNETNVAVRADHKCIVPENGNALNCSKILYLKNNWYGNSMGPYLIAHSWDYYLDNKYFFDANNPFSGARVVGELTSFDGFRTKSLIADPVLVIPGIMGSSEEMIGNDLVLDPILHRYDELIDSLEDNGYEKGKNLFEFPYDWRNSNVMTAQKLSTRLSQIKLETNLSLVDIVAHSMGGLVTRQYIQSINYNYDVDQLVTLGTPHKGSPQAYLQWEAGEGFFTIKDLVAKWHFSREARHNGYDDIFSYIRNRISSVKELLPDYDYLYDIEKNEMRSYPNDYPRNIFLENLNSNTTNLDYVRSLNIVGNTGEKTIDKIRVEEYKEDDDVWEHGIPEDYENNPEKGLELGNGDETVSLSSSIGFPARKIIELDATHGELPTKAQCYIFEDLTGLENCDYDEDFHVANVLMFNVFSPVDIQVETPNGKKIGKDFETGEFLNEVEWAYYTGADSDEEFITIPNPLKGEYKIRIQSTDSGKSYEIKVVGIKEDVKTGKVEEKIKSFKGTTETIGKETEVLIGINEQGEIQSDQVLPTIKIISPEKKDYLSNEKIKVNYIVKDDITSEENLKTEIFLDNETFNDSEIDLAFEKIGSHNFGIKVKDEAGNQGEAELDFKVMVDYDSLIKNLKTYKNLGWIKRKDYRFFRIQLDYLKRLDNLFENHKKIFLHWRHKKRLEKIFDQIIDRRLNNLIWLTERKIKNSRAKKLIVNRLEFLKEN